MRDPDIQGEASSLVPAPARLSQGSALASGSDAPESPGAELASEELKSSIAFHDAETAREVLRALKRDPRVDAVGVYTQAPPLASATSFTTGTGRPLVAAEAGIAAAVLGAFAAGGF